MTPKHPTQMNEQSPWGRKSVVFLEITHNHERVAQICRTASAYKEQKKPATFPPLTSAFSLLPFPVATHGEQHHDQVAAIAESSCIGEDRDWASASAALYSDAPMHV